MFSDNYKRICDEIAEVAIKSGRNPKEVTLVAVTKGKQWDQIASLYNSGQRQFGENRLPEAFEKQNMAPADCKWHLIGSLQSNKVRKAIGKFVLIHSVDTVDLSKKISQYSQELGVTTSILLQVNTTGETTKHGMTLEECKRDIEKICKLPNLSIEGLMTMAALDAPEAEARHCFAALRKLRDDLHEKGFVLPQLSMGMSRDFKWAIAEGATFVRIGSALFE